MPNRETIFCIHPISGSCAYYNLLAACLGNRFNLYAIESTSADRFISIDEYAKCYIDLIHSKLRNTNFCLLGWSMGGAIAFEMARQLAEKENNIVDVVLIDAYTTNCLPAFEAMDADEFYYHTINMFSSAVSHLGAEVIPWYTKYIIMLISNMNLSLNSIALMAKTMGLKNLKSIMYHLKNNLNCSTQSIELVRQLISFAKSRKLMPVSINVEELIAKYTLLVYRVDASKLYKVGYFPGRVILFKAQSGYKNRKNESHWRPYCNNLLEYCMPNTHYNFLNSKKSIAFINNVIQEQIA